MAVDDLGARRSPPVVRLVKCQIIGARSKGLPGKDEEKKKSCASSPPPARLPARLRLMATEDQTRLSSSACLLAPTFASPPGRIGRTRSLAHSLTPGRPLTRRDSLPRRNRKRINSI